MLNESELFLEDNFSYEDSLHEPLDEPVDDVSDEEILNEDYFLRRLEQDCYIKCLIAQGGF